MKETIILAPSANSTELQRTLAMLGRSSFALRIMNATELADLALLRCGRRIETEIIGDSDAAAEIYRLLDGIDYYKNSSYNDAVNIMRTLTQLRRQIPSDERDTLHSLLSGGEFPEANAALLEVYDRYTAKLAADGKTDTVGVIRAAIGEISPVRAEFAALEEYPLDPLETALLSAVSGGSFAVTSVCELIGKEAQKTPAVSAYTKSYGVINEAKDIISRILENNYPFDSCTIACAESLALPLAFYELSKTLNIPMTFGCGLPVSGTAPADLLVSLGEWSGKGLFGVDALSKVVFSPFFLTNALTKLCGCSRRQLEKAVKAAGNLRLGLDRAENQKRLAVYREKLDANAESDKGILSSLDIAEKLSEEFEKGFSYIVRTYAVKRTERLPLDKTDVLKNSTLLGEKYDKWKNKTEGASLNKTVFTASFDSYELCRRLFCSKVQLRRAVELADELKLSCDAENNAKALAAKKKSLDQKEEAAKNLSLLNEKLINSDDKAKALADLKKALESSNELGLADDPSENGKKLRACLSKIETEKKDTELAERVIGEFMIGRADIVGKYRAVTAESAAYDGAAVNAICSELDSYCAVTGESGAEIIPAIIGKRVCRENRKGGSLHITDIGGALACLRDRLFAAGLTSRFPGMAKENYLICDKDISRFGESVPTSVHLTERRRKQYRDLINTASAAGKEIFLSCCGFDTAALKANNVSSLMFETYRKQYGETASFENFEKEILENRGYFASVLTPSDNAAKEYAAGKHLVPETAEVPTISGKFSTERSFAITNIIKYTKCPRQMFYSGILGLTEFGSDDPMTVADAATLGNVFHDLMEKTAFLPLTEDGFLAKAEGAWERYLASRPPIDKNEADKKRKVFLDMAKEEYKYNLTKGYTDVFAEEPREFRHPGTGITVKCRFDRVVKLPNGVHEIIDYKTGKSSGFKENDFASCTQVLLYAYILKHEGITARGGEYHFLNEKKVIGSEYTKDMKAAADKFFNDVAKSIEDCSFELSSGSVSSPPCSWCKFIDFCGKVVR